MMNALDKELLKAVADLEGLPKGAFNIRKNGQLLAREVSANINIESHADGTGITVTVKPGTVNESVHIPVILSLAGLYDVVYNKFVIGAESDITIVAGCGIHCGGPEAEGHAGIHEFHVDRGAKVKYVEKHFATGAGKGKRSLNPSTKVFLAEDAQVDMELTQIGGVDEANRVNEATLEAGSMLLITEKVLTDFSQNAVSKTDIILAGDLSRANMIARSVIKGNSQQNFFATIEARAKSFGHVECDAIIMDNGTSDTVPSLKARHPDAELTHEASIGKIASDQLTKLMSLGLSYEEAVNRIIQGFLG